MFGAISTYTSESPTSLGRENDLADDDLSWWSCIVVKKKRTRSIEVGRGKVLAVAWTRMSGRCVNSAGFLTKRVPP